MAGSLVLGVYHPSGPVGVAHVISDFATFAYLSDVVIDEAHRGGGPGQWLVDAILSHPRLEGLRRWLLVTADGHGLDRRFGFAPLADPHSYLERVQRDARGRSGEQAVKYLGRRTEPDFELPGRTQNRLSSAK